MQAAFSDSSPSQSMSHLPTTSSSLQHQDNNSITSSHTSTAQPSSESIRLPLPVQTIKDEPDVQCVDIDLSELDSADSMGGSDSGSGYPSVEGMSGQYRMPGSGQGSHEQPYQVNNLFLFCFFKKKIYEFFVIPGPFQYQGCSLVQRCKHQLDVRSVDVSKVLFLWGFFSHKSISNADINVDKNVFSASLNKYCYCCY